MNTLITGGAGFFGRHLAKALTERGDKVTIVDNMTSASSKRPDSIENFYETDCRDFFKACDEQFDMVFHCAAVVGGRAKIEGEPIAVADDLSIDSAMWQWAVKTKPGKVINFSSSAVYPVMDQTEHSYRLLKENDISFDSDLGVPDYSYGWSKLTSEYLGKLAHEKHGIKSVVYRPFSGLGPDQHTSYPFPSLLNKVYEARDDGYVQVWGSGEQMRDFVHIDDCVRCVLETMDRIDDGSALNISTGIYTSFNQLIELAAEVLGKKVKIAPLLDKPVGVHARAGDTTKQREYGFTPQIPLEEGIKRYFDAHKV